MTTIAYDGVTLAADGLCTSGNAIHGRNQEKVFALQVNWGGTKIPAYFAAAGSIENTWIARAYLEGEDILSPKRRLSLPESFDGLIVLGDGQCFSVEGTMTPFPCEYPCSLGSGANFALAAMTMGKSAIEAVEVAAQLDVYTGGTIRTYKVSDLAA